MSRDAVVMALEASVNRSTEGKLIKSDKNKENEYTDAPDIVLPAVVLAFAVEVVVVVVVVVEEQKISVLSTKHD